MSGPRESPDDNQEVRSRQNNSPQADALLPVDESAQLVDVENKQSQKKRRMLITGTVLLVIVAFSFVWFMHSQTYEDTDDAQIDGHIAPISARISGVVTAVHVQDNEQVQVGQPLVDLDTSTQLVNIEQTRAQLAQADAQLQAQQPNLSITRANSVADLSTDDAQLAQSRAAAAAAESDRQEALAKVADAKAQDMRDKAQLQRYKQLYEQKEASREDFEKYAATAASSEANVAASEAAVNSASRMVDQRNAQVVAQQVKRSQDAANAPQQLAIRKADILTQGSNAAAAKAALDKAGLDLSFAKITAPVSGIVTERSAEIGTRVAEGAQMLMIVQIDDLWVTANFKETQLRRMRPQQAVKIHVDGIDRDFDGYVESMPAITGSRSSILPPENATGNYVKVVQRLPVRIRFRPGQDGLKLLRPGMSTEPRVYLR